MLLNADGEKNPNYLKIRLDKVRESIYYAPYYKILNIIITKNLFLLL